MKTIQINNLSKEISNELSKYTREKAEEVKKIVDDVSTNLLNNIKNDTPKRTGKYKKAMVLKTAYESLYDKRVIWHVKNPHYRLTHLLEFGHAKRNGGRVKAHPHIKNNEEKAIKELADKVERLFENG